MVASLVLLVIVIVFNTVRWWWCTRPGGPPVLSCQNIKRRAGRGKLSTVQTPDITGTFSSTRDRSSFTLLTITWQTCHHLPPVNTIKDLQTLSNLSDWHRTCDTSTISSAVRSVWRPQGRHQARALRYEQEDWTLISPLQSGGKLFRPSAVSRWNYSQLTSLLKSRSNINYYNIGLFWLVCLSNSNLQSEY